MKKTNPYIGSGRSFSGGNLAVDSIQNIVRSGYKQCSRRVYFLRFADSQLDAVERLKLFLDHGNVQLPRGNEPGILDNLNGLIKQLEEEQSCIAIDLGFTFAGLQKLKVKIELLETFRRKSPAFYDNAFSRAQKHLGDTGLSSPELWALRYNDQAPYGGFHMALIAHFPYISGATPPLENSNCILNFEIRLAQSLLVLPATDSLISPLKGDWVEISVPLTEPEKEHFGYRDGITAPIYSSNAPRRDDEGYRAIHALGEILLGHPRNDGDNLYAELGLTRKKNTKINLQQIPVEEKMKDFFKNSSFGVLRMMEQRVELFEKWVDKQAKSNFLQDAALALAVAKPTSPRDPYYISKKWIRSKLMGRTPEGVMLTSKMKITDMQDALLIQKTGHHYKMPGAQAQFHVRDIDGRPTDGDDSQGQGCPFSSHIRRMNPRDDPVTPFIHRPLIRRGMPYTQGNEKGMSGLFICADLVDQFEHLAGAWANHQVLGVPDDSTCRDPIIGNHEPQNNEFYLNSRHNGDEKNKLCFTEPFVITKGCAYIWFPSKPTLLSFKDFTNPFAK
jgi:deferrochelatase/peroxidase EfeB